MRGIVFIRGGDKSPAAQLTPSGETGNYDASGNQLYFGAPDYHGAAGPNAIGLTNPTGVSCVDTNTKYLFIADSGNSRILVFPLGSGDTLATTTASYVLGVPDFNYYALPATTTNASNFGVTSLGVTCDSVNDRLFVADGANNRVMVFNVATSHITNGESADYFIGQTSSTAKVATTTASGLHGPWGVTYDASTTRLFVADTVNNRVLVFNVPTSTNLTGISASVVLGAANYTTASGGASAQLMHYPIGLAYDASNARLFVADYNNSRVMVFPNAGSGALATNASATIFLGQSSSSGGGSGSGTNQMSTPSFVSYDSTNKRLFVADSGNNRVTEFNATPGTLATSESYSITLGVSFGALNGIEATQNSLDGPYGVNYDTVSNLLFVNDTSNQRIMVFPAASGTLATNENATYELGHADLSGNPIYTAVYENNMPNPRQTFNPDAVAVDTLNHRMFIPNDNSGQGTMRVAVVPLNADNTMNTNGIPQYELGWSDFYTLPTSTNVTANTFSAVNAGGGLAYDSVNQRLFVSDLGNNRVMVFNVASGTLANNESASYFIGQTSSTANVAATTASGLNGPTSLAYDSANQRLFVTDSNNNRVLVFNVPTSTNLTGISAVSVVGQSDFVSSGNSNSNTGLYTQGGAFLGPMGNLDYDIAGQRLFVPDVKNNRVLVFSATSTIPNGEAALNVLGQSGYGTSAAATTQSGFDDPTGVVYDQINGRLFVGDTNTNGRTMVFNAATSSIHDGENAQAVIGEPNFTTNGYTSYGTHYPESFGGFFNPANNTYFDVEYSPDFVLQFSMIHITNSSFPSGTVNSAYSQQLTTTSTQGTSQTFSLFSGFLPTGLSLSTTTGVISGTPTIATTTTATIEADDNFSDGSVFFDRGTYNFGMNAGALTGLTPSTLPNATTSVAYSQLLTESSGIAPYTWSVASGTLPLGLSLGTASTVSTTTISGTPTSFGTSNFTIEIQSGDGSTSTQAYAITVTGTLPTITASAASPFSTSSATLNGNLTSTGAPSSTIEGFNYGLTATYGTVVSSTNGGGFASGAFTQSLTGLLPLTTYYYQAYATNAVGTATSSGQTFTTASNGVPSATSPAISGTATIGNVLTGTYTFFDPNGKSQSGSTYQWLRSSSSGGSYTAITNATGTTYTLTSSDIGQYLEFQVTPASQSGTGNPATSPASAQIQSSGAPTASSPHITGTTTEGQTLTGAYTYAQTNNVTQGASTYIWLESATAGGTYTAIPSATADSYALAPTDVGKYLEFAVTPVAIYPPTTGSAATSSYVGPIAPSSLPVASVLSYSGTQSVGNTLTGTYTYSDTGGNAEASSTFVWLEASSSNGTYASIGGATAKNYVLQVSDIGKYLEFQVTPVSIVATGTPVASDPGSEIQSSGAPTASSPSITGTPAVGQTLTGTYTYHQTDNVAQASSTFIWLEAASSNGTYAAIPGATNSTYVLQTTDQGQYLEFQVTPVAIDPPTTGSAATSSAIAVAMIPSVAFFSLPATSTSLIVPIISFTASGTASGYYVSASPTTPSSTNPNWLGSSPSSYIFSNGTTSATLYAWVKDSVGNISFPATASVSFPYFALSGTSTVQIFTSPNIVTSTAPSVTSTTVITFEYPVEITIGASTVSIPLGTTMTTASSSDFTTITATTSVSTTNLPTNSNVQGAVQYGFATTTISLSQPVTISIPVDSSYNGQTFQVYQSEDGGVTWTALTTCVVSSGICSFTTSNLSSFAVVAPASSPQTSPSITYSGGSGYLVTPATTSTPIVATTTTGATTGMTISQMEALLASLEAQLQALEAQAGKSAVGISSSSASYVFTRDLQLGMTGNDVKQLQLFLIAQNSGPAARKLAAHGTTQNFASLTKAALIEFQKKAGITPAAGYFGAKTRAWVNAGK